MIKNIIFDFDGVVVDSEVLASKAFSKYFSKFDKSIKEEQFYKYAGKKTVEVIDLLSSKYKIENNESLSEEQLSFAIIHSQEATDSSFIKEGLVPMSEGYSRIINQFNKHINMSRTIIY